MYVVIFLVTCAVLLVLFFLLNNIVHTKMKKENKFRQFWEREICSEIKFTDEDDLKDE